MLVWTAAFVGMVSFAAPDAQPAVEQAPAPDAVVVDADHVAELIAWLTGPPDAVDEETARERAAGMAAFEASLPWQQGTVTVSEIATLELGPTDRFLGPDATAQVLEAWGNPPGQVHGGMLFPQGAHVFGANSWGVIVGYEDMGWVDDADAATIDYDELLSDLKAQNAESVEARRESGLVGLTLKGWAETPHYDASRKVLYWARELVSDDGGQTLNYEVRVLGRGGVLSLNAVGGMDQLATIRAGMEPVRASAAFIAGQTYADYEPGVDPSAGVGIAALVAGGALASKAGLFKGLLAALLAGKKLVIAGVVGMLAIAGKFFSGSGKE